MAPLTSAHFLSVQDLDDATFDACLALARRLKQDRAAGRRSQDADALSGQHVALLFEKPSLRTRSTFEIAVRELGGDVIVPDSASALSGRESWGDVARNLERWVAGVVIRTFSQARLTAFAAAAPRLHVINALTDEEHPCQGLADALTLQERLREPVGQVVTYIGDGNNVALSLAQACVRIGLHVRVASPDGYELSSAAVASVEGLARFGATVTLFRDPREAAEGAAALYTDVWTSMGQEHEAEDRRRVFAPYQVNASLLACAGQRAYFMHCLPAHRGEEVTDEVMDGPTSVAFDQAENRLHVQKAVLRLLMGAGGGDTGREADP